MFRRLSRTIKRDGVRLFLVKLIAKALAVDIGVKAYKIKIWSILREKYNYKVAYGAFLGMSLPKKLWWGDDRITQTLGIYEAHVLSEIIEFSKRGATQFIDVGAADGYFVVGFTFSKIFSKSVAFEISQAGQARIYENARLNQCEDRIEIHGEADIESISKVISGPEQSVVLVDIEGGEYDFLSDEMLKILSKCYVICELHHNRVDNGLIREQELVKRASKIFNTRLIKRETYNPNAFPELDHLDDNTRLLAVSESRSKNTHWLVCTPK